MTPEQQIAELQSQLRYQQFATEAAKTGAINAEQTASILCHRDGDPAEVTAAARETDMNLWQDMSKIDVKKLDSHKQYMALRGTPEGRASLGLGGHTSSVKTNRADFIVDNEASGGDE